MAGKRYFNIRVKKLSLPVNIHIEKNSYSIEIFQIVQRINTDGWQKVYQYKGKKVISNVHIGMIYTDYK